MKKWKEHNDGDKYYMGNKETIEINCTDKGTAKSIQDSINGVYECMDWKCNWCGELHTDDRDYTDYKDRVDEYLGDAITEIRTAVKDKKSKKEMMKRRNEIEEQGGEEGRGPAGEGGDSGVSVGREGDDGCVGESAVVGQEGAGKEAEDVEHDWSSILRSSGEEQVARREERERIIC